MDVRQNRVEVVMVVKCNGQAQAGVGKRLVLGLGVLALGLATGTGMVAPAKAAEPAHASPWVTEQTSRTRAIAGGVNGADGRRRIYAGVEIVLDDGWKTYWRNPGSSGVPPRIDWEGSENVASAELLFPAPVRFVDKDGDTIGYKSSVVLPIALTPKDASKPMSLKLSAEFGICREVCIPVQPVLALVVPVDAAKAAPGEKLASALARVPQRDAAGPAVPRMQSLKIELAAPKPRIVIEAVFPGDPVGGDLFLEAPDGIWIPLAKAIGAGSGDTRRFEVDLTDGADLADLKARTILMTLVSKAGQSEIAFKFE